ncbi:ribbon-helix-helix domain-containing protein [Deinococcus sp. SL84]|uniref:ribbon-helix-helix domain-containing protein n=1 Tax=Deinococcus sp. SL84 TaxID=2994663 RepID=UPI002273C62F|nr:ribbon-helix-helix domain-containing protein [Deinococcus sp. SL84]MCY1703922.1 hypothetical protein [Deinococcus sp. SL84]
MSIGSGIQDGKRPPSRAGKKGVTVYLTPEVAKLLRSIALDEDKTLHAIMLEAVEDVLRKRNLDISKI